MSKNNLTLIFLVVTALTVVMVVQAESGKKLEPGKASPGQVAEVKPATAATAHTPAPPGSRQGYQLATEVLDSFGGASESANFRISVNSGGQPSPPGLSESTNWLVKAGYVFASRVKRGDANADGTLDLGDAIYILNYLFKAGPDPCPMEAGDANGDGMVDLGDAIYVLNYLFKGGPAPSC
jgi:hypothetical protein